MGQRLVVEIKDNDKLLANAYYHWSGYTSSSRDTANEIMNYIDENPFDKEEDNPVLYAIDALEKTGALCSKEAQKYAKEEYNRESEIVKDRSEGIIEITEDEMDESHAFAEALVTIEINSNTVLFYATWCEDIKDYEDDFGEDINFQKPITINIDFDPGEFISQKQMNKMCDVLEENDEVIFNTDDKYVYGVIA